MMLPSDQPAPIDLNRAPTKFQRERSRQSQTPSLLVAGCNAQSPQCRGAGSDDETLAGGQGITPGQPAIGFGPLGACCATPANNSQHNTEQHSTHCPARTHHKGTEVCCCPACDRELMPCHPVSTQPGGSSFGEIHSRLRQANAQTCIPAQTYLLTPDTLTPFNGARLARARMSHFAARALHRRRGLPVALLLYVGAWCHRSASSCLRSMRSPHGSLSRAFAAMARLVSRLGGAFPRGAALHGCCGVCSVASRGWHAALLLSLTLWSHFAEWSRWHAWLCGIVASIRALTPHPCSPTRVATLHRCLTWCCLAVWWFTLTLHSHMPDSPDAPPSCLCVSPALQWSHHSHRPPTLPASVCSRSLVWIIPTNGHDVKNRGWLYAPCVDMLSVPANRISRRPIRTSKSIPRYEGYIDR